MHPINYYDNTVIQNLGEICFCNFYIVEVDLPANQKILPIYCLHTVISILFTPQFYYSYTCIFNDIFKESQSLEAAARDSELSCKLIKARGFLDNCSIDVIKANQAWPYSFPITKAAPD